MISNEELLVIQRAAEAAGAALTGCSERHRAALQGALDDLAGVVTHALQIRADLAGRPATGRKGRVPTTRYIIDVDRYAPRVIVGGQAATDAINEHLAELGTSKRLTLNNMTTSISTKGAWTATIDTDSGTVGLSVRRAPEQKSA